MTPKDNPPTTYPRLRPEDHRELLRQTKSFLDIGRILLAQENKKKMFDEEAFDAPKPESTEE